MQARQSIVQAPARLSARAAGLALLVLAACGNPTRPSDLELLSQSPYIRGVVVEKLEHSRVLVTAVASPAGGASSALVDIAPSTSIRLRNGVRVGYRTLAVGQNVIVYTTGVERRSLPPQVTGRLIVIEPQLAVP